MDNKLDWDKLMPNQSPKLWIQCLEEYDASRFASMHIDSYEDGTYAEYVFHHDVDETVEVNIAESGNEVCMYLTTDLSFGSYRVNALLTVSPSGEFIDVDKPLNLLTTGYFAAAFMRYCAHCNKPKENTEQATWVL